MMVFAHNINNKSISMQELRNGTVTTGNVSCLFTFQQGFKALFPTYTSNMISEIQCGALLMC